MQKANLTYSGLTKENIPLVAALSAECFTDPWSARTLEDILMQKSYTVLTASLDNELVGYLIINVVLDEAEIVSVAVANSFRRKGLARKMINAALVVFNSTGSVGRVMLEVREGNNSARALYASLGFSEDGMRKNFYTNPTENAVLMSKEVSQ